MNNSLPKVHRVSHGKMNGASPAEDRFYTLIFYDISDARFKYLIPERGRKLLCPLVCCTDGF